MVKKFHEAQMNNIMKANARSEARFVVRSCLDQ